MIRMIRTLFSGGELFGVGARAAGYAHVDGYEIDPKIAAAARRNGFTVYTADVVDVAYESLDPAGHLHVSPSCKRASRANVTAGETDEDLAAAGAVVRAIRAHQGDTFSLENVIDYRWFESYDRICQALRECGFIFRVVAKGGEAPAWRESTPQWNDAGEFVDAADFGVPQNRKRLILRAVRGRDRLPGLRPTHGPRGGILLEKWIGWYASIDDLIPSLPDTTPAPWQLARMPKELRETLLIGQGGYEGRIGQFAADEPAPTITANRNHQQLRAYLLAGAKSPHGDGLVLRADDEPATTVVSADEGRIVTRAYLVNGQNAGQEWSSGYVPDDIPAPTISNSGKGTPRAFLLSDQSQAHGTGVRLVGADDPAPALRGSNHNAHLRAYTSGRWVRMTIQALGRFQTVPDNYQGLTAEINGNGVPCLLARRIMESFL